MSDEFETVNVRRGDRVREFDALRTRYRAHRDSLGRLAADAPTERLAVEYRRLIGEIDGAIRKLDELEGRGSAPASPAAATPAVATPLSPADRPLEPPPDETLTDYNPPEDGAIRPGNASRLGLIVAVVIVALAAIGAMIWRASSDRSPQTVTAPLAAQSATAGTATSPAVSVDTVPAASSLLLKVAPAVADYGVIRKGTRAVRQFEVTNEGSAPLTISVSRSGCRCLYYDYNSKLAPKKRETVTVTVDGSKTKPGPLEEQLQVSAKEAPEASTGFTVRAMIR
jgi:hypothetical protein